MIWEPVKSFAFIDTSFSFLKQLFISSVQYFSTPGLSNGEMGSTNDICLYRECLLISAQNSSNKKAGRYVGSFI